MTREDIKKGDYIVGYWIDDYTKTEMRVIVKMETSSLYGSNPHIDAINVFKKSQCLTASNNKFRKATPEEMFWLDECIKQDKSIPLKYIDFTKMNINYEIC